MNKIVINTQYGGFGLSQDALRVLRSQGVEVQEYNGRLYGTEIPRHHPALVAIVESMGANANGDSATLEVVEVDRVYKIEERDGLERVKRLGADWIVIS